MKQTFDLVSHFFALLPLAVLGSYLQKDMGKKKPSLILFIFLVFAVTFSIVYHAIDKTSESFHTWQTIDRFTSSAIVILTFWLYIDRINYWVTTAILGIILVSVLLEANSVFGSDWIVDGILLLFILVAIFIFLYRKCQGAEDRIYELKDPFFGSFFLTQILAVTFFLIDTDPYFHSLWHMFAFISLGSVIIHSLPGEPNKYGEFDREFYVGMLYWLGSLPSRLFISWIFIDMGEGEGLPLGIVFAVLCLMMASGLYKKDSNMITPRRAFTMSIGVFMYFMITILLFFQLIGAAGGVLLASTLVSAASWFYFEYYRGKEEKYTEVPNKPPTLKLHNMVF